MDKHVEQDDGRESSGQEPEFLERIWKEEQCGGALVVLDSTASEYLQLACLALPD